MSGKSAASKGGNIITFLVKFIFKFTASLVVELLKFGALSLILAGFCATSLLTFLYITRRSYLTSDGNVFYTLAVAMGTIFVMFIVLAALQYLVKNVLKLTNMTLLETVLLYASAFGRRGRTKMVQKEEAKASPSGEIEIETGAGSKKDL